MKHGHKKHEHNHHHHKTGAPLAIAIALNLFITVAQVIGGLLAGSLALLGDALHNFSDVLALVLSYVANRLRNKKSTLQRTFGYKRAQVLAAFLNALTLIGVSIYLIIEAVHRFTAIHTIKSGYVMLFALAGILVNGGSALLLVRMQHGDSNFKSAYLHLLGDLATSFAVLAGGITMHYYGVYWIDSLITVAVSGYLLWVAGKLVVHTVNVLMQFVPSGVNLEEICDRLREIEGVENVHHVHVWRLDDDAIHFEGHVKVTRDFTVSEFERIRANIEDVLKNDYGIVHCILQPETLHCANTALVVRKE